MYDTDGRGRQHLQSWNGVNCDRTRMLKVGSPYVGNYKGQKVEGDFTQSNALHVVHWRRNREHVPV